MISANVCKINSLALICEYCEKHIEPLLLNQQAQFIMEDTIKLELRIIMLVKLMPQTLLD